MNAPDLLVLARRFPSLAREFPAGVTPDTVRGELERIAFGPALFLRGARHAARFCLSEEGQVDFDVIEAWKYWDGEHQSAFLSWALWDQQTPLEMVPWRSIEHHRAAVSVVFDHLGPAAKRGAR